MTYQSGYKDLVVWKEAKELAVLIYKLTDNFPKSEDFGLKSQMRRAAVSIMSQIAEGWSRRSKKDKLRYLEIAEGSLFELESQSELVKEIDYWSKDLQKLFDNQRAKFAYLLYRYKIQIK